MTTKNYIGMDHKVVATSENNISINNIKSAAEKYGRDYFDALYDEEYDKDSIIDLMDTDTDYSMTEHFLLEVGDKYGIDPYDGWMDENNISEEIVHSWIMDGAREEYGDAIGWQLAEDVMLKQDEWNKLVDKLAEIAPNYDYLTYGIDYLRASVIIKQMARLGEDLLEDMGKDSHCTMCEEDGYWFDHTEFDRWACGRCVGEHIGDLEEFAEDLDYMATDEDRICPMSENDYKIAVENYMFGDKTDKCYADLDELDIINALLDYLDELGVVDTYGDRCEWANRVMDIYYYPTTEKSVETEPKNEIEMPF